MLEDWEQQEQQGKKQSQNQNQKQQKVEVEQVEWVEQGWKLVDAHQTWREKMGQLLGPQQEVTEHQKLKYLPPV